MAKHDRHFVNVFSAVLGVLIAIAIVLIGISRMMDKGPKGARDVEDPLMRAQAHERVKPFGQVAVAGNDNSGLAIIAPPSAPAPGDAAVAAPTDGPSVYASVCSTCHKDGLAGAPKFGDRAAWAPRIAKGIATLDQHAIQGFQGSSGFMPAKGGRAELTDELVKAAVQHMVSNSG